MDVHGEDWKKFLLHAVEQGVHTLSDVMVQAPVSNLEPFTHCWQSQQMLLPPSTCTFLPTSLYVIPAEHGTQLVPRLDLTYPALQSLQGLVSAETQTTHRKTQNPPRPLVSQDIKHTQRKHGAHQGQLLLVPLNPPTVLGSR